MTTLSKKQRKMRNRILIAAALLILVKLLPLTGWVRGLCCLAPYFIIGYDVLRKAALGIVNGQVFDENFLMALATVGAYATGEFDEAVFVMLFYQTGELFQDYAVGKSRTSIAALMDIRPDTANLETENGLETVDPEDVAVGSVIVVKPGERVPLDGTVLEGSSTLDTAALTGECINGFHEDGHYHFTNNREEVQHSRSIADHLLQKAQPLMEIYKAPQADLFRAFLKNDAATVGARQNILSAPPLYTMPEDLLGRILKRSGLSAADAESINATLKQQTENIGQILTANTVIDELPHVSEEAFRASPLTLSLSNAFIENTVTYTYEEYTAHLKATKIFAEQHPNYTVRFVEKPAFRNIQIQIHENEWVMLSKSKDPAIHFVIRHSKMLSAFQNMILPYVED